MIHKTTGDLLLSKTQLLAHGVAPNDHFDQGLALALREQWPAMVKDFRHWCHQRSPSPGEIWVWSGPGTRIACLLTQEPASNPKGHPGKAQLKNVNHALRALHKFIEDEGIESVALPRLATGVGGLDWDEVRGEIEKHLGTSKATVVVYEKYEQGVAAKEPLAN